MDLINQRRGEAPGTALAIWRGLRGRCPACGDGRIFPRFLKVATSCPACGTELHHHRADDLPPYVVIFIVGHIVGYGIYSAESHISDIPLWIHGAIWPALTVLLCLAFLQPVKGAVVGLQYGLGMHGFEAEKTRRDTSPSWRASGRSDGAGREEPVSDGASERRRP